MQWSEIRAAHPDRWLVLEALEAHSERDHRIFDRVAIVEVCDDGRAAMKLCSKLHRDQPGREFCFVHSSSPSLEFEERLWLGLRGLRASGSSRTWITHVGA